MSRWEEADWTPPTWTHEAGVLRVATREDLPALLATERAAHAHPWTEGQLADEFTTACSRVWCVASGTGDAPALLAHLVFWVVYDELHIQDVAVHPAAQRRGLARALIEALAGRGVAHEAALITLEVRRSNAPAIALYTRCGFLQVGVRKGYYVDGVSGAREDALLLTRHLSAQVTSTSQTP